MNIVSSMAVHMFQYHDIERFIHKWMDPAAQYVQCCQKKVQISSILSFREYKSAVASAWK